MLIGFLDDFPGWWTQGKETQELETMLLDLYDLCDDEGSLTSAKAADNEEMPAGASHGTVKVPLVHAPVEGLPKALAV
jgi:hypothetical protein